MGVSLKIWASIDGQRVLEGLAKRSLPVRILIMNPKNPGLGPMINTKLPTENLDTTKLNTQSMDEYFRNIMKLNTAGSFQVRTIVRGLPHFQLILTDKTALVLQYMFCRGTQDSPLQQFPALSELYKAFFQEFDTLWTMNEIDQVSETKSFSKPSPRETAADEHQGTEFELRKPY
jgi:hypothetical protein